MNSFTAINALLVGVAIVCAHHARDNRDVVTAVWLVAVNWFITALSQTTLGPAFWLSAMGVDVDPEFIWAVTDATCAGAILSMGWFDKRLWAWALWALYFAQCGFHIAYTRELIDWPPYRDSLDGLFLAQIAVFLLLGGRSTAQRINDFIEAQADKLRDVFLPRTGRGHDE